MRLYHKIECCTNCGRDVIINWLIASTQNHLCFACDKSNKYLQKEYLLDYKYERKIPNK